MTVRIYSTSHCPYCTMAKKFFEDKGISFEEVNVEQDQQKAAEMVEKSGQMGVPVIEINGEIIIGFNRPEIEKALGKNQ
jgi:glutaredoxin 3